MPLGFISLNLFLFNNQNMLQMTHERAMNRLTDMLRNAQTTCTDTECFNGPCKNTKEFLVKKTKGSLLF
jgi:hypothetical protein